MPTQEQGQWQDIASAPRDGQVVLLLSKAYDDTAPDYADDGSMKMVPRHVPAFVAMGKWDPDGTSWVDEHGFIGCDRAHHLEVTGIWLSGGGWFQPDEVTHWMPLPHPPLDSRDSSTGADAYQSVDGESSTSLRGATVANTSPPPPQEGRET